MKNLVTSFTILLLFLPGCNQQNKESLTMLERDQLIAWCIVPFDAMERTPLARAVMLNELGITKLAYDYRDRHLQSFEEEISALEEHGITLSAVWLWIQDGGDHLLDTTSEFIIHTLEATGTQTSLWVSFPDEYYANMSDDEKLAKAVLTLGVLNERLKKSGCTICLYNHGAWFGEPENQVKIIQAIGSDNIGMVYNFHHGHHQVERFGEIVPLIAPYLKVVNLNGMRIDGPKIIDIGKGKEELRMLKLLIDSGFDGEYGILGHTEGEDIKVVLERNLKGLEELKRGLK